MLHSTAKQFRISLVDVWGFIRGEKRPVTNEVCNQQMNHMTERKSILRSLIILAIPTVLEEILATLLQYVDTAMVGRLGEEATAAVNVTQSVSWLVYSIPGTVGIAVLSLISQAYGSGDKDRMQKISKQVFYLVLVVGLLMGILCVGLSPFIPVWMGAEEKICQDASMYFSIVSLCMVFRVSGILFGAAIRAIQDTKTPMLINLFANLMNVVLNFLFIYGLGMGVKGAAFATMISYSISGCLMFIAYRRKELLRYSIRGLKPDKTILKEIQNISVPLLGTSITSHMGYIVFASLVTSLGTTVFAAHSIAVTAEQIFYIAGYGVRTATSTLIGASIGEKNERKFREVIRLSVILTTIMMCFSGGMLYLTAKPLMSLFTNSDKVVALGAMVLAMVALSEPFFGLMIVMEGVFYGTGKTKYVFVVETFSMWCVRILCTYICVHILHLGLDAVWLCMIADNVCKALLLSIPVMLKKGGMRITD